MRILFSIMLFVFANSISAQFTNADSVPVRISSITSEKTATGNKINWKVSCSLPFANFEVQRSPDGANYTTINSFQADELRCQQPFDFTDPLQLKKSFYRIKVGDIDGRIYSSKVVAFYGQAHGFDINTITPSIISQNTVINITSSSVDKVQLSIISLAGISALKKEIMLLNGNNEIKIELGHLPKGSFFITIVNSKGVVKSSSILKL